MHSNGHRGTRPAPVTVPSTSAERLRIPYKSGKVTCRNGVVRYSFFSHCNFQKLCRTAQDAYRNRILWPLARQPRTVDHYFHRTSVSCLRYPLCGPSLSSVCFIGKTITHDSALPLRSCTTDNKHIVVAESSNIGNIWGPPTCGVQDWGSCIPSGASVDKIISQFQEKPIQGFGAFYSPGLVCPSGWTTAGVASHGAGGSLDLAGVFTEPAFGDVTGIVAAGMPQKSVILNILDPAETLLYCCPR